MHSSSLWPQPDLLNPGSRISWNCPSTTPGSFRSQRPLRQPRSDRFHLDRDRLQFHTWSFSEACFSKKMTDRIAASQALSTKSVYDGKWRIFCAWCGGQVADPFTASISLIAESTRQARGRCCPKPMPLLTRFACWRLH